MTAEPSPVRPAPLEPGRAYSRTSGAQAAGLLPAVELFERSAEDVELPHPPLSIVIADYGASAGHNSLLPIGIAISALRKRAEPGRAIFVVHTDVAENDYATLFDALARDPHSYLRDDPATFSAAIGRSFYQQILPSNSVTLGWSSWAVQWLSRVPAPIPDHVGVAYSHDSAARSAYRRQAADDWIAFLTARSRELVPGGHLVVLTMALDDGDFGYRPLLEGIVAELAEMVTEGLITGGEARRMAIPTTGRSEADLTAPFAPKNRFSGLTIEDLEVFAAEDQYWTRYERDHNADNFAAGWTAFGRASVFPTLATALEGGLDDRRAGQFLDRLSAGVKARLTAAPEPFRIPMAKLLVVKQSWPR
ncbi:SAM-dependent methyltransferase [Mycobacterium sp.]|uniref:SAM-dependent methyltransferase n=1 Tax=Mycobacterium sp. TaxID=1785 RepID=UPI002C10BE36|nr:SAM-dependent methyltransferase [Mycobacterium sp.]HME48585.1 SAM-dependent methyltransferase [Mycobacterium sp.]